MEYETYGKLGNLLLFKQKCIHGAFHIRQQAAQIMRICQQNTLFTSY